VSGEDDPKAWVYLLHFDEPYPGGHRPQHYIGVAADLLHRLEEHRRGESKCRLTSALREHGIGFTLVRTWPCPTSDAAFERERALKRRHRHSALCPRCNGNVEYR